MIITNIGAFCFGVVIGWVTYRTLRRTQASGLSDIATVIGAIGGAAITGLFRQDTGEFGYYCIGLIIGFFGYLLIALILTGQSELKRVGDWLGSEPPSGDGGGGRGGGHVLPPQ
jgi:uncharacterized membrane protein YeaQ/YmgE (transglycosylase-associated protein family)